MKKILFVTLIATMLFNSCAKKSKEDNNTLISKDNREAPDFSKGVMDEKILWYLGRLSDVQVSPDGKTLLYSVK